MALTELSGIKIKTAEEKEFDADPIWFKIKKAEKELMATLQIFRV